MSLVKIPEAILLQTIEKSLKYIRTDYAAQTNKERSWLSKAFKDIDLKVDNYNFYDQLVNILITKGPNDPRYFEGDLMFNRKRERVPSYHITLPSESLSDGNTIGIGQTDFSLVMLATEDEDEETEVENQVFTRRIQTNYNIVIMSDNSNEVVALYHLLRAILIANSFELNEKGIENLTHAGQDLQPYKELAVQTYMRAISIGFQYQTSVPSFTFDNVTTDINTIPTPEV